VQKLWAKLSIDIHINKRLEHNAVIEHGHLDHEFDKRVWSRTEEKKNIRLVLSDIK
jgi:hypothetical protein